MLELVMPRLFVRTALAVALVGAGVLPATANPFYDGYGAARMPEGYRPLPPPSGTLRAGRYGLYGDRSFGAVRFRSPGFAPYGVRRSGFHRFAERGVGFRAPYRPTAQRGSYGYGYGVARPVGPSIYAGQGFVPEAPRPAYAPVGYGQAAPSVGYSYDGGGYASGGYGYNTGCGGCGGQGGGVGFFTQGSYGGGPRVIEIAQPYTVTYRHAGCGCGSSGLFGSFGGAY